MLDLNGPAWRFALAFYHQPGIAPALLSLQDRAGVDTIQVLLVVYAAVILEQPLSADEIDAVATLMQRWHEAAVLPIRTLRRALKPPQPGLPDPEKEKLRNEIKRTELLAEQVQLALGADWLAQRQPRAGLPLDAALRAIVARAGGGKLSLELEAGIAAITEAVQTTRRDMALRAGP
jgi:uncharacterized protein (TIGR02444 family)